MGERLRLIRNPVEGPLGLARVPAGWILGLVRRMRGHLDWRETQLDGY